MLNKLYQSVMMTPPYANTQMHIIFFFYKALVETYVLVVWIYEYKLLLYSD